MPEQIERPDPEFVREFGWTFLQCPDCKDVVYQGAHIQPEDRQAMIRAHIVACRTSAV
ncbi:hypothetical protein [Nocardia wallacei]|uniref:hypothetical protein n=1 Tax=Nocardia wallacei TaxID=480035 RepID=UPI002456F2C6|nr:hypothetical protein [Nocardia wallacei]